MAKILRDSEMIDIIRRAPEEIDCFDAYTHFIEDLGDLIADHFGGTRWCVGFDPGDNLGHTCAFLVNENVPDDGGVYKDYDTDVVWSKGVER